MVLNKYLNSIKVHLIYAVMNIMHACIAHRTLSEKDNML
jgi:hypothetical protein